MPKNFNNRLAAREQALAAEQAAREQPIMHALAEFIFTQPAPDQAAFWRVVRVRHAGGRDTGEQSLITCGGTFDIQPGDNNTYQRLCAEFFGDDDHPPAIPHPPAPEFELA
jgi:hypothetical protein